MEWLSQNWVWVLIGIAFIVMHMVGHGGHGSHGGHATSRSSSKASRKSNDQRDKESPPVHHH